jgi:glycosidase
MNAPDWSKEAFFYHIYPLGLLGAPLENKNEYAHEERLKNLYPWLDHLQWLGVNAIYLGPIFESSRHGYDTNDYFKIDKRLGSNQTMKELSNDIHNRGMRLILDGVFNHTGRGFWAFKDLKQFGLNSSCAKWYQDVNFDKTNPMGDGFDYETWNGNYELARLNFSHPPVVEHLLSAVQYWMDEWQIDGLRLDAADCVPLEFWKTLRKFTTSRNSQFWLMGEIIHGDYRNWANNEHLHSTTNYECYKGLYSSLNDNNFFEIAYSLNRLFGDQGIYRNLDLYNFVDNHDVNRIASQLNNFDQLDLLYALLFSIPGIPSIYYGSEWGIMGERNEQSDYPLRPYINLNHLQNNSPCPNLPSTIRNLAQIRQSVPALVFGNYQQAYVSSQQFAFWRILENQQVLIAFNACNAPSTININTLPTHAHVYNRLNSNTQFQIRDQILEIKLDANGAAIIIFE